MPFKFPFECDCQSQFKPNLSPALAHEDGELVTHKTPNPMKNKFRAKSPASMLGWILFPATTLIPGIAMAVDWTGGTGGFGVATNWDGGVVPSNVPASILNAGTATVGAGDNFTVGVLSLGGHSGQGTITQDGGAMSASQIVLGGDNVFDGTGVGTYTITSGTLTGTATGDPGELWVGSRGGVGTFNIGGDAVVTNASWIAIGRDRSAGHVTMEGNASLSNTALNVAIGVYAPGFTSTMTMKGSSTLNVANELYVGWGGDATNIGELTLSESASIQVAQGFVIGRNQGKGFTKLLGQSKVQVGGFLVIAADGSSEGALEMADEAEINVTRNLWIGQNGAHGVLDMNGGTIITHPFMQQPGDDTGASVIFRGASGVANLNGGTLVMSGFKKNSGTSSISLNGTLIQLNATGSVQSFFGEMAAEDITINAGGFRIDTGDIDANVQQSLGGSGGVWKSGYGILSFIAETAYTGDTEVEQGTVAFFHSSIADSSTVRIGEEGVVEMVHDEIDTVRALFIDGVQQPDGDYVRIGSSTPGTAIPQLAGDGVLRVDSSATGGNTFDDWLADNAPATGFSTDSDGDGLPNGVEHVLGSNPNTSSAGLQEVSSTGSGVTFTHSLNDSIASNVTYGYEWSTDLTEWVGSGVSNSNGVTATLTASAPVDGEVTLNASITSGTPAKFFVRLVANLQP